MKVCQLGQLTGRKTIAAECAAGLLPQSLVTRQYLRMLDLRGAHFGAPLDLLGFIDSSLFLIESSQPFGEILEVVAPENQSD